MVKKVPPNKKEVLIGDVYGKLSVVQECKQRNGQRYFLMFCECGNSKEIRLSHLVSGKITSCGCYRIQQVKIKCSTHCLTKHPLYNVWSMIKRRCYKQNSKNYNIYGQRGIRMCDQWKSNFENFYNWCIDNGWSKGLQIDRIDNNGIYSPENCRWVTPKTNSRNRSNNHLITYNNETKSIAEWAEIYNIKYDTLRNRIVYSKMSIKDALNKPVRKWH